MPTEAKNLPTSIEKLPPSKTLFSQRTWKLPQIKNLIPTQQYFRSILWNLNLNDLAFHYNIGGKHSDYVQASSTLHCAQRRSKLRGWMFEDVVVMKMGRIPHGMNNNIIRIFIIMAYCCKKNIHNNIYLFFSWAIPVTIIAYVACRNLVLDQK